MPTGPELSDEALTPVGRLYRDETESLLAAVGLLDKADEVAGFLSHGNQKQIELGIAPRLAHGA